MNKYEFFLATHRWPEQDDLERANCPDAGTCGHAGCGICTHGKPTFTCHDCFVAAATLPPKSTNQEKP